jgi:hypothetical protein
MYDLSLKLDSIQAFLRAHPRYLYLLKNFMIFLLKNPIPQEIVMLTLESHSLSSGMCEIIALVSDDHQHLGRHEKYDNCVYSQFSDVLNRVVILEKAKEQPGYLSLDDRVKSEMFFEYAFSDTVNLILNAEFSSAKISDETNKWFERMCEFFSEKKNDLVIRSADNRQKED